MTSRSAAWAMLVVCGAGAAAAAWSLAAPETRLWDAAMGACLVVNAGFGAAWAIRLLTGGPPPGGRRENRPCGREFNDRRDRWED